MTNKSTYNHETLFTHNYNLHGSKTNSDSFIDKAAERLQIDIQNLFTKNYRQVTFMFLNVWKLDVDFLIAIHRKT